MPAKGLKPRKRADGRWEARPYLRMEDGTLKRVSVFGRTAEEALRKARELVTLHEKGLLPRRDPRTLQAFAEAWLARKEKSLAAKTLANYRREVGYFLKYLGQKRLQDIRPLDIRQALDRMAAEGLGVRAQKKALLHLRALFKEALGLELVARDPTAAVRLKAERRPKAGRSLEPHEAEALLAAFDAWPTWGVGMALRLCLALGLRAGEALGLKWGDIDLEAGTLSVRRAWTCLGGRGHLTTPKTSRAQRTIPVPRATLGRLRDRWETLVAQGLRPKDLKEWWVFPSEKDPSRPLNPHSLNHALRKMTAKLGIPPVRVHDLRHSYGSLLLANGAPLELVAERMGHASPNVTLSVYRHLLAHERTAWVVDPEDLIRRPRAQA
ncbi:MULTISPECIES: site-specific integrase [Thermus]|uniref:Transposase n=1 Tax=Thermus scotoductus (strain ATCC 700910 / SA-01) TaxID=743525 RepID=E8PPG8_THESS|nr:MULTISPECIES: site-specific integrase [Thermus]ADW21634.1 transposase [Thermus scotoductus SA-01]